MKLLTFNLLYGGKKKDINYWNEMISDFDPDIIFVQESNAPHTYFQDKEMNYFDESVVWDATRSGWGSAIYVKNNTMEKIDIPGFNGWVVGGKLIKPFMGQKNLFIFSIHTPSPGPYDKNTFAILDVIKKIVGDHELVIAGDFNMTTALRHESEELKLHKADYELITKLRKDFGLMNSWQIIHPNKDLPQTLRWNKNKKPPYHIDGIFIPFSWAKYIDECEVIDREPWNKMSDHNPILLSLESYQ